MLVLSRKLGEDIEFIQPDGTVNRVRVLQIERGKIKLGFEAPADVTISRPETRTGRSLRRALERGR
jgi:carbon storage regulator CsrA